MYVFSDRLLPLLQRAQPTAAGLRHAAPLRFVGAIEVQVRSTGTFGVRGKPEKSRRGRRRYENRASTNGKGSAEQQRAQRAAPLRENRSAGAKGARPSAARYEGTMHFVCRASIVRSSC